MLRLILKYASKHFIFLMLLLLTLEQAAGAAVTGLLALAGKNLLDSKTFLIYMVAAMLASQLPNLIQVLVRRLESAGYLDMYFEFLNQQLLLPSGDPAVWASRGQKERYLASVGAEANTHLTAVAFSFFDAYAYVLNVALNTITLSIIISLAYSWVFALAMLLSYGIYIFKRENMNTVVDREQTNQLEFGAYILGAWDNLFLRNQSVAYLYTSKLRQKFRVMKASAIDSAVTTNLTVFLMGFAAVVPVLLFDVYLATADRGKAEILASMVITLPRQLQVLGTFRALFVQITNLKMFSVRFKAVLENSRLLPTDLARNIDLSRINVDGQQFATLNNVVEYLEEKDQGRVLINGPNGAGKSSMLLHLHSQLQKSFYLPSAPNFEIGIEISQSSTGENILRNLEYMAKQDLKVVLLDEWNANLDPKNRAQISRELDRLSEKLLVIEVRH